MSAPRSSSSGVASAGPSGGPPSSIVGVMNSGFIDLSSVSTQRHALRAQRQAKRRRPGGIHVGAVLDQQPEDGLVAGRRGFGERRRVADQTGRLDVDRPRRDRAAG